MSRLFRYVGRAANLVRFMLFSLLRLRTLGARAIAVDSDGCVLLVRVAYAKDEWTLPGGGVHKGETFKQAALRELKEETGFAAVAPSEVRLLGVYMKRYRHWLDHVGVFIADGVEAVGGPSWEISEVGHFPLNHLPSQIEPSSAARIAEWQGSKPISEEW